MPATASPNGSHRGDLGPDLREDPSGNGGGDRVKHLEQVLSFLVAGLPDSLDILSDRFADDLALLASQSSGSLAEPIHRLLIKGKRELHLTETILPYSTTVKRVDPPHRANVAARRAGWAKRPRQP